MVQFQMNTVIRPPAAARVKVRKPLPLGDIANADVRSDLAYRYWQGMRVDHSLLPNRQGLDHAAFRFLVHDAIWLNVESGDPGNWDISKLVVPAGAAVGNAANDESMTWQEAFLADCKTTRFTGTALFQRIEIADPSVVFEQLLLPLADDGIHVDTILVVQAVHEVEMALGK